MLVCFFDKGYDFADMMLCNSDVSLVYTRPFSQRWWHGAGCQGLVELVYGGVARLWRPRTTIAASLAWRAV